MDKSDVVINVSILQTYIVELQVMFEEDLLVDVSYHSTSSKTFGTDHEGRLVFQKTLPSLLHLLWKKKKEMKRAHSVSLYTIIIIVLTLKIIFYCTITIIILISLCQKTESVSFETCTISYSCWVFYSSIFLSSLFFLASTSSSVSNIKLSNTTNIDLQ